MTSNIQEISPGSGLPKTSLSAVNVIGTPEGFNRKTFLNVISACYTAFIGNQGRTPTIQEIKKYCPHTEMTIGKIVQTVEFQQAIELRGIPWKSEYKGITPEQQRVITLITNPTDRRPLGRRLKSAGVSWVTYQAWCKQPHFKNYVDKLAEEILQENISTAHTMLTNRVQNGDLNAIKFFYELTGRHDPNRVENVNLRAVITQILEIIQRRVRDPETLQAIASDMSMLGGVTKATSGDYSAPTSEVINASPPALLAELPTPVEPLTFNSEDFNGDFNFET